MSEFSGCRVAITGAAQGIGFEVARQFASAGAGVAVIDLQEERANSARHSLRAEIPGLSSDLLAIGCDVSDESSVRSCFDRIRGTWGHLDVLVNAAGILHVGPIDETAALDFTRVMSINAGGTFLAMKHAKPLLDESSKGSIVNFSSLVGKAGSASLSAYSASKAAVVSLTHVAALEFAPQIRVNAVLPGIVDTAMQRREYEILSEQTGRTASEIRQDWEAGVPLKRLQEPSDIADAVLYLASDRARSVTGHSLAINGGLRMD